MFESHKASRALGAAVALLGLALAIRNPVWFDSAIESSTATTLVGVAAGLTLAALILVARRQ